MKKFSFKAPRTQVLSVEKRAMREQMLRAVPEELLSQIRGGVLAEGCHVSVCCCGDDCSLNAT